jgi:hypothetical protein
MHFVLMYNYSLVGSEFNKKTLNELRSKLNNGS